MSNIVQEIFDKTNGGLDIILAYYPQAEQAVRKNTKFKIREERTPSATLNYDKDKDKFFVVDHGTANKTPLDALNIVMKEERIIEFSDAIKFTIDRFKIQTEAKTLVSVKAKYSRRNAEEGEAEKQDFWERKEEASIADLKTLFAQKVWLHLLKKPVSETDRSTDETAARYAREVLKRFSLYALKSYSQVRFAKDSNKNPTDKLVVHTFESTDAYPIFMYDETKWQKFYQPRHEDKGRRFHYYGTKPPKYIFGLEDVKNAYDKLNPDGGLADTEEQTTEKLPEIIICSGGSDAINVAALGYHVVWFNSETINKADVPMPLLRKYAHKVCYLPDIDTTGIEVGKSLSLEYLDIHTIWLPLPQNDKVTWKDIRDWFRWHTAYDFKNLLADAKPLRFWKESVQTDRKGQIIVEEGVAKRKYSPHPVLIRHFLHQHGYCKVQISDNAEDEQFVKIDGNIVSEVTTADMRNDLLKFITGRHLDIDLQAALMRSKDISDGTLAFIEKKELDFTDFDEHHQLFFFQNAVWKATANSITATETTKSQNFVWQKEVIKHDVKLAEKPPFRVYKNEKDDWDIEIHDDSCLFFRFLINTSRTHWRTELEERLDKMPNIGRILYEQENKFKIDGSLLLPDEIAEQKRHLISKISAYGYLLHRYKKASAGRIIFAMDYVMDKMEESNGGTGKSMIGRGLKNTGLMTDKFIDGRKDDMKNSHLFEGITEHTDLLWLDDADKSTNIEMFFSAADNDMSVNPKGKKGYTVPFDKSPKLLITSNFPPFSLSASLLRRLWFLAFSDYYHYNKDNRYRSDHTPVMDLGKDLFRDFNADDWNNFYNFVASCTQTYMEHGRIEPPMESLMSNAYRNRLGANFLNWANVFFDELNETLNCYIPRVIPTETYRMEGHSDITGNGFKEKVELWCRLKGYELNPKDCLGHRPDGRLTLKRVKPYWDSREKKWIANGLPQSIEYFYIKTPDVALTEKQYL